MKKYLKSVLVLTVISVTVAVLLSVVNQVTLPIIEERKNAASNEALLKVMPEGKNFTEITDLSSYTLPETVTKAYSEEGGGYVIELSTTGYASGLLIMCGVDSSGTVTGATCLSSNETNKAEVSYGENFKGLDSQKVSEVDTVANSTKTTTAYKNAILDAINSAKILKGESVDLRTEEEKLFDSFKEILPNAEGFEKEFISVKLFGVSAVYKATNNVGYIFMYRDQPVATNTLGEVLGDYAADVIDEVGKQAKKHLNTKLKDIDISGFSNLPTSVLSAQKTDESYVLNLRAAGFGILGDSYYGPSGEYIKIKVSLTKKGEIISCVTVSESESANYGAACKEPEFYNQFEGKTEKNYEQIDAISGATVTTTGYLKAIKSAFEAVKVLEGGQ